MHVDEVGEQELIRELRYGMSDSVARVAPPNDLVADLRAQRARRHRRGLAVKTLLPAGVAAAALGMSVQGPLSPSGGATTTREPAATSVAQGSADLEPVALMVAGRTFVAPAGFTRRGRSCPGMPRAAVSAPLANRSAQAAVSADGGCLQVAGLAPPPSGGRPVEIGDGFDGHLQERNGSLVLTLTAPSARGSRGIVFVARGIGPADLVAIARRGLHTFDEPSDDCSSGCG